MHNQDQPEDLYWTPQDRQLLQIIEEMEYRYLFIIPTAYRQVFARAVNRKRKAVYKAASVPGRS